MPAIRAAAQSIVRIPSIHLSVSRLGAQAVMLYNTKKYDVAINYLEMVS